MKGLFTRTPVAAASPVCSDFLFGGLYHCASFYSAVLHDSKMFNYFLNSECFYNALLSLKR
jgi:hypothetical protein